MGPGLSFGLNDQQWSVNGAQGGHPGGWQVVAASVSRRGAKLYLDDDTMVASEEHGMPLH